MKKSALLCGLASLSLLFAGCSAKENPIVSKDYKSFNITSSEIKNYILENFSDEIHNEDEPFLDDEFPDYTSTSVFFDHNVLLLFTTNEHDKVTGVSVFSIAHKNDNESIDGEFVGKIFGRMANILNDDAFDATIDKMNDRSNDCSDDNKFGGSAVSNYILYSVSYRDDFDDESLTIGFTPSKYSSDREYLKDGEDKSFCESFLED